MLRGRDIDTLEKRRGYSVCVLGRGRVGLPQACLFAQSGFRVAYADADHYVTNHVERSKIAPAGRKLRKLLTEHIKEGNLTVENDVRKATSSSQIIVFSVPAVIDKMGKPDYSHVIKACRETGLSLPQGSLFICSSTTGPGVTESLVKETLEDASGLKAGTDFGLAYSPMPTRISQDRATGRIVGAVNDQSREAACAVLSLVTEVKLVKVSSVKTAEVVTLLERIHCDVEMALANELAVFCERAGVDLIEVQEAMGSNPHAYLALPRLSSGYAGPEPQLLYDEAESLDARLRVLKLARRINEGMVGHATHLVNDGLRTCGKNLRRAKIAVLGVSSRRDRKAAGSSLVKKLADALKRKGGYVWVYDSLFSQRELAEMGYQTERTLAETLEKADCLVIAVGHSRFARLNMKKTKFLMKKPAAIVDMGRIIDPDKAEKEGFVYRGVGRGVSPK